MQYPQINGIAYGWAEVVLSVAGLSIRGVKGINYSESVERGKVRGTSQRKLALTSGEHDAEGDLELYMADWYDLLTALGDGYMMVPFAISASYTNNIDFHTDELTGVRIKKVGNAHAQGNEPLTIKLDLDIMRLKRDGLDAIGTSTL
jgi:hypothetical protein